MCGAIEEFLFMGNREKDYFKTVPEGRLTPGIVKIIREFEAIGTVKFITAFQGRQDIVTFHVDLRGLFETDYECAHQVTLVDMLSDRASQCEPVRVDLYKPGDYPDFLSFMNYVLRGEYGGCGAGIYYHAGYLEMAFYRGVSSADDVLRCLIQQADKGIEDTEKMVERERLKYGRRNEAARAGIECLEAYLANRQGAEGGHRPIWNRDYEDMVQSDIRRRKQEVMYK